MAKKKDREKKKEEHVDPDKIVYLSPDEIAVPDIRVTSSMDKELFEELKESIKVRGILEPLSVAKTPEGYVLVDGLHRLWAAKDLGMTKVPCLVKEMSMDQILMENLIRARQRGKSNPADEANVLMTLVNEFGYSLSEAAKAMGISVAKAQKLSRIATLDPMVLEMVRNGQIGSEAAYYISFLEDPELQRSVAQDVVFFNYTTEQVKARVAQLMNPQEEPEEGGWTFTEAGEPVRVPYTCHFCQKEIHGEAVYAWFHKECLELIEQFRDMYMTEGNQEEGQEIQERKEEKPQGDWWPY